LIVIASQLTELLPYAKYWYADIASFNFPSWTWGSSFWRNRQILQINCLTNTFL